MDIDITEGLFDIVDQNGEIIQKKLDDLLEWAKQYQSQLAAIGFDIGSVISIAMTAASTAFQKRQEAERQRQEAMRKRFEAFEIRVQLVLDDKQLKKDWNNLMRELTIDEDDHIALSASYLTDYKTTLSELETIKDAINELDNSGGLYLAEDRDAKRQELVSELQSKLLEGSELLNTLEEMRASTLEDITESYENQVEYIANINSLIEHQLQLTELIYGEKAYSQMSKYYKAIVANQISSYQTRITEYNYLRSQYLQEQASNNPDSEYARELKNQMVAAGEEAAAAISEITTAMQENYINSLNAMMSEFVSIWTNGQDLEAIKEEWDWIKDESEAYFDEIEAAFEIQKVANEFQKRINNTTNLNAQERLNALREEELKALKEKDKLTKYDVDRAKTRFEILQAEIALQEAQENKTKMRLMRGADGTYGYQYVIDQDKITEEKNKLTELNQELYDLDKEEYEKNLDSIYDSLEAFLEKYESALTDGTLDQAEKSMLERLWNALSRRVGDNVSILDNLIASMEQSGVDISNMSDAEIAEKFPMLSSGMAKLVESFVSGDMDGALEQILNMGEAEGEAFQKLLQSYGIELDEVVSNVIADNKELIATEENMINKYKEEQEAVDALAQSIANLKDQYTELAKSIMDAYTSVSLNDVVLGGQVSEGALKAQISSSQSYTIASMDSGGYTGSWGSSGKLAVLHEEELVLNKQDTSNILSAVQIMRQYVNNLDSIKANFMRGFDMPMAAWELAKDMKIEQNVHITAEFPEASERDEITAAFEQIINLATQHAFDNTRN